MATEAQREAARKGAAVTNQRRREKAAAEGRKPREKGEPKLCLCGCQETTKGGTFVMGHDARYKSKLIKTVLSDPDDAEGQEALAVLQARGWIKFLDKAREVASRSKAPRERKVKTVEDVEQTAAERTQVYADMKAAKAKLAEHGITRANSITRFNYQVILDGDYPFDTLGWKAGMRCQVPWQGSNYDGQISEIAGDRAKVDYDSGDGMVTRVYELASLLEPRTDTDRRYNAYG